MRERKVKHVAGHVHVGGFLPFPLFASSWTVWEGSALASFHLSPSGFEQRFDRGVNHCASGPPRLRQTAGEGRWTCWCPSVGVSVSPLPSLPPLPRHSPFCRCIYCLHAAGMFTTSAFPVSRGKQLDAPPWHRFTSSRAAASAPSCSWVTWCLSASAINGFLC